MIKKVFLFLFVAFSFAVPSYGIHSVSVNFEQNTAVMKDLLGVNRLPENMEAGYKEAGVRSVRLHDVRVNDYQYYTDFWNYDPQQYAFTTINEDFDPLDPQYYHWELLDPQIEMLSELGIDIYFRSGISWPDSIKFPTPPLTPPFDLDGRNFKNFSEVVKNTAMHFNDGWDNGFHYNIKYWEVWNEPGGEFWKGSPEDFYKMYHQVSTTLKQYNPDLRVGGPGAVPSTIVVPNHQYFRDFLAYLKANSVPIDFYSWHLYGIKNPYGLKYWASYVRDELDASGFTQIESHVTEINDELDEAQENLEDDPVGAAYMLSMLFTAQESEIDKMFWYPGYVLANEDVEEKPDLKWNGYAFKIFSSIYENTPFQLKTSGSLVVEGNWQDEETNFMVLGARSESGNKVYLAVSNFRSEINEYEAEFNNLPWSENDTIKITINIVAGPDRKFTQTVSWSNGNSLPRFSFNDMSSPSISFIRLEKLGDDIDTVDNPLISPLLKLLLLDSKK